MRHCPKLLDDKLKEFLKEKELAWAETTMKVESARLSKYLPQISCGPRDLWDSLQSKKPYYRLVTWNRVCEFISWALPSDPNRFEEFKTKNKRLFKNCYQKKKINISFSEAESRIKTSPLSTPLKQKALELLYTGMRYKESFTRNASNEILGKGNKPRKVYSSFKPQKKYKKSYHSFYRGLKKIGLTPHMLRKLAATRAAEKGAKPHELCEIFGWSNISTGYWYFQTNENKLKEIME